MHALYDVNRCTLFVCADVVTYNMCFVNYKFVLRLRHVKELQNISGYEVFFLVFLFSLIVLRIDLQVNFDYCKVIC